MSRKLLFVDRDGTLIAEPADQQVDSLAKLALIPQVIPALLRCVQSGYELVMVTNQDGLGTEAFPQAHFDTVQDWMVNLFASQGIRFAEVLVDASLPAENKDTRKPGTGLVRHYLADDGWSRAQSAMVGDRDTDMQFAANIGVRGLRLGADGVTWPAIAHQLCDQPRQARVERNTRETKIVVDVDLDAAATPEVSTGIAFFDHMLQQLGTHGGFTLKLSCKGDLDVDEHHSVEDCALAIGQALREALGDKRGIGRYGFTLPMDETLAQVALDLSGRPYLVFEGSFHDHRVGGLSTEMVPHFFRSLCEALGASARITVKGENTHHMVEGCFKAFAHCLREAIARKGNALPSTKGSL